jgi:diadenosine tetraphosphate (Ap4A) HIT family hydrolase
MQSLYAPWRDEYLKRGKKCDCVFCAAADMPDLDEQNGILHRDEECFCIMNLYPYTPGHFLIIPYKHECDLENLEPRVWTRMAVLAQLGVSALKESLGAQGVNIGMNLGDAGGAGIAEHLHLHVLPRWKKDTNFITTVADTRVYSTDFEKIFKKLKAVFDEKVRA